MGVIVRKLNKREGIGLKEEYYDRMRGKMVDEQIVRRGIESGRVIGAFLKVKRHLFVDEGDRMWAYEDYPLPIGFDQTISQPYIVALMTDALDITPADKVLEIGTGSGYQTAILAELAQSVYTIERIEHLQSLARQKLAEQGYANIHYQQGNGYLGWEVFAPYDKIIVTACAYDVPKKLFSELKEGGRMVIPIGDKYVQKLELISKSGQEMLRQHLCYCRFVTMVDY